LREQNTELSDHLKVCKNEIEQMKVVMEEVEKQRESIHEHEKELSRLSSSQAKDSEVMQSNLLKKLNEQLTCIELRKEQLLCAEKLTSELESCRDTKKNSSQFETAMSEREKMIQELQGSLKCQKQANSKMKKFIRTLEADLSKQIGHSENLESELGGPEEKPETDEQKLNRSCLVTSIRDQFCLFDLLLLVFPPVFLHLRCLQHLIVLLGTHHQCHQRNILAFNSCLLQDV
jgi:chromosome segregation ATPase